MRRRPSNKLATYLRADPDRCDEMMYIVTGMCLRSLLCGLCLGGAIGFAFGVFV